MQISVSQTETNAANSSHSIKRETITIYPERKWRTEMRKQTPEPEAVISLLNLKPNSQYQFRVISLNSVGISSPSSPSGFFKTLSKSVCRGFHALATSKDIAGRLPVLFCTAHLYCAASLWGLQKLRFEFRNILNFSQWFPKTLAWVSGCFLFWSMANYILETYPYNTVVLITVLKY